MHSYSPHRNRPTKVLPSQGQQSVSRPGTHLPPQPSPPGPGGGRLSLSSPTPRPQLLQPTGTTSRVGPPGTAAAGVAAGSWAAAPADSQASTTSTAGISPGRDRQ